ncbi:MAG: MmcQ/YjbR family DNA-binding protein [Flavobacteriales bacterium]|nr:MmcQ/YjbR family DNA-binding protein [Flavobacteriales bacterium]MCC6936940.1 MmcQ/YjbR family DNA-binding protein [Flavobacteriales bacterium]
MDAASARDLVLALPGATEHDHFGKGAYRVPDAKGKPSRIFMTLWIEENRAVFMLNVDQQSDLHARYPTVFFPVPNRWGEKGATFVELKAASEKVFREGLTWAINNAVAKK